MTDHEIALLIGQQIREARDWEDAGADEAAPRAQFYATILGSLRAQIAKGGRLPWTQATRIPDWD